MSIDENPQSAVTRFRPEIWTDTLRLASATTGYGYLQKLPNSDGIIWACGGGGRYYPPMEPEKPKTQLEIDDEAVKDIEREIGRVDSAIVDVTDEIARKKQEIGDCETRLRQLNERRNDKVAELKRRRSSLFTANVFLPEGAMEWLLHDVGHWIAASDHERNLVNYGLIDETTRAVGAFEKIVVPAGHIADREWQAWAFEEIVLAPFGHSRDFAPLTQRDGVAFEKPGQIPRSALRYMERCLDAERIDVEHWRSLYGKWIAWEKSRGLRASWLLDR